jgi:hypothetical protein
VRVWVKRVLLGILLLVGLYLLGVNLFLNTPLSRRAFNRNPERFQMSWSSAWTVWPGYVHTRGLKLRGHVNSVTWFVDAARARGWIDLPLLSRRTLRIAGLHAEEVTSRVLRGDEQKTAQDRRAELEPDRGPDPGYHPWTLRFEQVRLAHIRQFDFNDVRLTGDGGGEGAFSIVIRDRFRLEPSHVRMPGAQLFLGRDPIAQGVDLEAWAEMGPYAPHDHPGLEGFDFLSGKLQARGRMPELPFLGKSGLVQPPRAQATPGGLLADLKIEKGRLAPGSRFDVTAPGAGPISPFAITTVVTPGGPAGTALHIGLDARGLAAGRIAGHPPLLRAETLSVSSTTPETRLSRLFANVRDFKDSENPELELPLSSDLRGTGVQIEAPGSRAVLHARLDRAQGRIDLAGLLDRQVNIRGLNAEGVTARLDLARPAPPTGREAPPWTVRIAGLHLAGIREVGLGGYLLAGDAQADATFSYLPDGTLAVPRAALRMPAGRFQLGGETVAEGLSLQVEARVEPSILGQTTGMGFLRYVSGTAGARARISSLGFLRDFLQKTPWLTLQGRGTLNADVRMDHGRLDPGTRLEIAASPIQITLLSSRATGRGTVRVAVDSGRPAPRTGLRVQLDRFLLEDLGQKGFPDYIRGSGLRIAAVAPGALDLTAPVPDFDATLDVPDGEVPDLKVYNALLPAETGFAIVGGRGRARLHLEASTATNRARGSAVLTSEGARVRFQNLDLTGRLNLRAPLVSPDFQGRRFDLKGTRLEMDGVSYSNLDSREQADAEAEPWWMRAELTGGSIVWGSPLSLRGEGKIDMKNSGPLLTLFSQRSRFLRWFDDVLNVENLTARGMLRLGDGVVEVESLQATGGPLEVRSRMSFSKTRRWGDLFLRYGRLAAGLELRDGRRTVKLIHPLEWYEGQRGAWERRGKP